ncbi:MAG: glycosyltransferase [Verrucomicrobia bacterium]|nr:glycosyltransferase [Verrucomicrobiota bacterium]
MERIGVMQITDTLSPGGLERMAVNLANSLPPKQYRSHLCITRQTGSLEKEVSPDVMTLSLSRRGRFDLEAIRKLSRYLCDHQIHILHAHGTSLFIGVAASLLRRQIKLIWHDHYGRFETEERKAAVYRFAAKRTAGIISVTEPLAAWAREKLGIRSERVWYVSNFASFSDGAAVGACKLPGKVGFRIVCVANLRPEKNHLNLLHAFGRVVRNVPDAHLLLVGAANDPKCLARLKETIEQLNLCQSVTWLGSRTDVQGILKNCDIGVLSSSSEGLPLALIEYGMAGLPAVATNVGECGAVLDQGRVGLLVPPSSPDTLAHALLLLLRSAKMRKEFSNSFSRRVAEHYSADSVLHKICEIYDVVMEQGRQTGRA